MNASQLVEKSLEYIALFGPYLLIFFAIAFSYKLVDLVFYAMDARNRRR